MTPPRRVVTWKLSRTWSSLTVDMTIEIAGTRAQRYALERDGAAKSLPDTRAALREWLGPPIDAALMSTLGRLDDMVLQIVADDHRLLDVPWELMVDDAPVAIVRDVVHARRHPIIQMSAPLRVVLIVNNANDERLTDAAVEIEAFRRTLPAEVALATVCESRAVQDLRDVLHDHAPDVVHVIGHGGVSSEEGFLVFCEPSGSTHWLSAAALAALLPSSVRLLALATWTTIENYDLRGLARFAFAPGTIALPPTIAMTRQLAPADAAAAWGTVYRGLAAGDTVAAAVRATRPQGGLIGVMRGWSDGALVPRPAGETREAMAAEAVTMSADDLLLSDYLADSERDLAEALELNAQAFSAESAVMPLRAQAKLHADNEVALRAGPAAVQRIRRGLQGEG